MKNLKSIVASLPAVLVALLPQLFCPACWPAYASLLSSLGIGFVNYSPVLMPLTIIFLLVAMGGLIYKCKTRRGYLPFLLGVTAAAGIVFGKFVLDMQTVLYFSIFFLVVASVWNVWPKKTAECPT